MAATAKHGLGIYGAAGLFAGAAVVLGALAAAVDTPMSATSADTNTVGGLDAGDTPGAGHAHLVPALSVLSASRLPTQGGLREQFWLLNPSPLFLPGSIGSGVVAGRDAVSRSDAEGVPLREGGSVAAEFPASLGLSDRRPAQALFKPRLPASPLAAGEEISAPRWFDGLARSDDNPVEGARSSSFSRLARFEVYRVDDGAMLKRLDLASDAGFPAGDWGPLTLTAVIDAAGAVVRPQMVVGSGNAAVDDRVRAVLGPVVLLKTNLRAGTYRMEVGP